jgi:predicted negative regulator of RcsB-dependent stress response
MPAASPPTHDASVGAQVFWLRFQKEIAAALIVVVLAMIGFAGYRFYKNRRDSSAAELLGAAKAPQDFQEVASRYPNTPAAASAYLLLAEKFRNEKKFTEANAALQEFIDKNAEHDFVPTAKLALAANLEAMGKSDEALAIYQQVAAQYPNSFTAPLALISEVPLLKAKNRTDEARRICEEILTKYRMPGQQLDTTATDNRIETVWAGEAMRHLRSLKPPEQPKSPPPTSAASTVPPMIAAPQPTAPISSGAPTPNKPK